MWWGNCHKMNGCRKLTIESTQQKNQQIDQSTLQINNEQNNWLTKKQLLQCSHYIWSSSAVIVLLLSSSFGLLCRTWNGRQKKEKKKKIKKKIKKKKNRIRVSVGEISHQILQINNQQNNQSMLQINHYTTHAVMKRSFCFCCWWWYCWYLTKRINDTT